jgi:chromosome segregation ATPase
MNKVEGKVGDFCPNCKNCKGITNEHDGKTASIRLTEVECVDPYDGMTKTLNADSDICCSMFEPKPDRRCEKCERFDGTYCHGPNGTITISYKALFDEPVDCPSYEEKNEKEQFNLNTSREQLESNILDLFEEKNRLNGIINGLEKEKAAHMKGIERLKKSQEKLQNQVKNLRTTNEESYKREEKLEDKVHKLERRLLEENKRFNRLDTEFLMPLAHVLYPREAKICKPYSEVLKDIKLLNKGIYDLKEDNKRLADKNKALFERDGELKELIKASKRKDDLIQSYREKLKKANDEISLLNSKLDKLGEYYRTDEKFIDNIQKVVFPQEEGSDYTYSYDEILNKVKDLKVQSDENGLMYNDLGYWKERCHKAETNVTTLNSKVEVLDKRNTNQFVMIGEKDKVIENLKKAVERRDKWVEDLRSDVDTLQNECLVIADIAKRAYDASMAIKEENANGLYFKRVFR